MLSFPLWFQAQAWTFTPDNVTKYLLRAAVFVGWESPAPVSPQSIHYNLRIVGEGALGTIKVKKNEACSEMWVFGSSDTPISLLPLPALLYLFCIWSNMVATFTAMLYM